MRYTLAFIHLRHVLLTAANKVSDVYWEYKSSLTKCLATKSDLRPVIIGSSNVEEGIASRTVTFDCG